MEILQTERQKKLMEEPTRLDTLTAYHKRYALNEELREELNELQVKHKAEQDLLRLICAFGKENWIVLQNIWMKSGSISTKCDLALITEVGLYTFEIDASFQQLDFFEYKCYVDYEEVLHNPIYDVINVLNGLKEIFRANDLEVNVDGHLVYMDPDAKIEVIDLAYPAQILTRNQVRNTVRKILKEEKYYQGHRVDPQAIFNLLEENEINNPYPPLPISEKIKNRVKPGIYCVRCENFDLERQSDYIICRCGLQESLEKATVRTICDYGILNNDKTLYPPDLYRFFDKQVSLQYIEDCLEKHFTPVGGV